MLSCHDRSPTLVGMSTLVEPRTVADEVADAYRALDAAEREMENWRAHLAHLQLFDEDAPAISQQATRSARIVKALIADAEAYARAARVQSFSYTSAQLVR